MAVGFFFLSGWRRTGDTSGRYIPSVCTYVCKQQIRLSLLNVKVENFRFRVFSHLIVVYSLRRDVSLRSTYAV